MADFGKAHFGTKLVKALRERGIVIYGLQAIPDETGSYLRSQTGYLVNDNGTGRLLTYFQVRNAAGESVKAELLK